MDKQDLWKIYSDKNPQFDGDGKITMSAAGLRKLFNQTYDQAHEQGHNEGYESGYQAGQTSEKLFRGEDFKGVKSIFDDWFKP